MQARARQCAARRCTARARSRSVAHFLIARGVAQPASAVQHAFVAHQIERISDPSIAYVKSNAELPTWRQRDYAHQTYLNRTRRLLPSCFDGWNRGGGQRQGSVAACALRARRMCRGRGCAGAARAAHRGRRSAGPLSAHASHIARVGQAPTRRASRSSRSRPASAPAEGPPPA